MRPSAVVHITDRRPAKNPPLQTYTADVLNDAAATNATHIAVPAAVFAEVHQALVNQAIALRHAVAMKDKP